MTRYFKVIAENRKARHDYTVIEVYKAGIVLSGSEVKSVRLGRANLKGSFAIVEKGELYVHGMHISTYEKDKISKLDPMRVRKLLLNRGELRKIIGKAAQKGFTLIPLKLYFEENWAKIDLGLCKSKKLYEKKEAIKARDIRRETEKEVSEGLRNKR